MKLLRIMKIPSWVILPVFVILMEFVKGVEMSCYLDMTGTALLAALAETTKKHCPPGQLIFSSSNTTCINVKHGATMPYWNTCKTGFYCKSDPCPGDFLEVDQPCNATQFATCRNTSAIEVSTVHVSPIRSTTMQDTSANHTNRYRIYSNPAGITMGASSAAYFALLVIFLFVLVLAVLMLLYGKKWNINQAGGVHGYKPAGRKAKKTSEYRLRSGTAVIIKNSNRNFIDVDVKLAKEIFELLLGPNTECVIEANSSQEVETKMKEILNRDDLGDCFACVVLGHGAAEETADGLICKDKSYLRIDILKSWLYGSRCPKLLGKPKIIFNACCRGGETDVGTSFVQGSVQGAAGHIVTKTDTADILVCNAAAHGNVTDSNGSVILPGKIAYFDASGSVYLRVLKDKLLEFGQTEDLLSILTEVGKCVGQETLTDEDTGQRVKQHPSFTSTFESKLYIYKFSDEEAAEPSNPTGPSVNGYALVSRNERTETRVPIEDGDNS